jgi:hypothetical protein
MRSEKVVRSWAGEPGTSDTYRIRTPDISYDSGTHTLEGGNIQIAIS